MTVQSITIELPEQILQRIREAAHTLNAPIEDVLEQTLVATFSGPDAPPDMESDLARMAWLSDHELWEIARSEMSDNDQTRLQELSAAQEERELTPSESIELEKLRETYARVMLRKARAYALLSIRSGEPLLRQS